MSRPLTPIAHWDAAQDGAAWAGAAPDSGNSNRYAARDRFGVPVVIPKRRWPRRVLIATNLLVGVMLVGAVTVYGYANWRFSQIRRILLPHVTANAPPGAPMTILVVGSDSRSVVTGKDAAQFGGTSQVSGQRSDTIMLVHVDPASTKATLLSIPRDLWVPIPGKGFSQRINTTFDSGPDLLVQTIEQSLGIPIDHYVEVNFQSFRDIVNAVGGVKEYFPTPARDAFSLLKIPAAGCYSLNGEMALQFVRARHYEYRVNGRWVFEAESDLARIKRQQSFIKKTIAKAQGSGLTNPLELNQIIGSVTNNLTLDKNFSQSLLLSLGKRFRALAPDSLPTVTLPTTAAVIGGADVLLLQQPAARQAISDFLAPGQDSTTTSTTTAGGGSATAPSSVRVTVLNGTGRPGEASKAAVDLQHQGFVVSTGGSAPNFSFATTTVRYRPGQQAKAQLVASAIEGPTQLQSDANVQGDVELITGLSFEGIKTIPGASGVTTPTTRTTPTTDSSTPTSTVYELPGTPAGFTPPPC